MFLCNRPGSSLSQLQPMKKVRFETPTRGIFTTMEERECHSPRPFMQKVPSVPNYVPVLNQYQRVLPYFDDPVTRYESSDSSPYPTAKKTQLPTVEVEDSNWRPSSDLDLSMLDASSQEPRHPIFRPAFHPDYPAPKVSEPQHAASPILSPILNENKKTQATPPNVLSKDNSFFIRRDNLDNYHMSTNPFTDHFNKLHIGKENKPAAKKSNMFITSKTMLPITPQKITSPQMNLEDGLCRCHHYARSPQNTQIQPARKQCCGLQDSPGSPQCPCIPQTGCQYCVPAPIVHNSCKCGHPPTPLPQVGNAVDKKTWALQKFEKSKNSECLEMSKQKNMSKEKREPTVADLFRIIKLQNEQLQLLQEKVDKFVSGSNNLNIAPNVQSIPVTNYVTEHVALQTVDHEQHKISIGVMTSFEMVHTSTVINKEILTQTTENAQIQCNRSQISIKEVVSKPMNLNFLDGLAPNNRIPQEHITRENVMLENENVTHQKDNVNDEKTLNEMSLYNVQVDNVTTPLISPEQTMYLDVRDYSDSESSSNTSPVGWTYYNKVMTHVNGMLQESEMPSSASAMYRNTRQKFMQMHIDKTNVSVTKRVKFGDDPLGVHQPHIYAATSDTSWKMNQLAAKYLNAAPVLPPRPARTPVLKPAPIDMSIATRNYMERHNLLQGTPESCSPPNAQTGEMPRFLDITSLKQQTKLL